MMEIEIQINGEKFEGELDENMNPETVEGVKEAMPLKSEVQSWGDEFYFRIPVDVEPENEKRYVNKGELGYWPEGNAFCIFFGETPGSPSDERIKPASPVNVIGRIERPEDLKNFEPGVKIEVREVDSN